MELKEGDKIYCHTNCIILSTGEIATTIGKYYKIDYFNGEDFRIIDDCVEYHYFSTKSERISYYKKWFHSNIKEIRKEKLKKINEKR